MEKLIEEFDPNSADIKAAIARVEESDREMARKAKSVVGQVANKTEGTGKVQQRASSRRDIVGHGLFTSSGENVE